MQGVGLILIYLTVNQKLLHRPNIIELLSLFLESSGGISLSLPRSVHVVNRRIHAASEKNTIRVEVRHYE